MSGLLQQAYALHRDGQAAAALPLYLRFLEAEPAHFDALHHAGIAAAKCGQLELAKDCLRRAVVVDGSVVALHHNLGSLLQALGDLEAALQSFARAAELAPAVAEAHQHLGAMLLRLGRPTEALPSLDRALALKPDYAEACNGRGAVLSALGRHAEAMESYTRAATLRPDFAQAHHNRAVALRELGCHAEAVAGFARVLDLQPDYPFLRGRWLHARMQLCDWDGLADARRELFDRIERGQACTPPFALLALSDDMALQRRAAEIHTRSLPPMQHLPFGARAVGDRIRLGFYSADLHDHATAHLMVDLFEQFDRARFELTAFSFGPETGDAMQQRLRRGFQRWVDVGSLSAAAIVRHSRELGIDIAIDLKGYTRDARPAIFKGRAAPVQVSYVGYPGTLAMAEMDYLIADAVLVPPGDEGHYSEQLVRLTGSYQPNGWRAVADLVPTRAEAGLPQSGFVYACFNASYKITPEAFDVWMRVLKQVPDSVLWLLQGPPGMAANLQREAAQRSVDAKRLVFAAAVPQAEHLARQSLADLFLDTWPYNAHTTASDALWVGLPVLTRTGGAFAGRVAASLLHAVGLAELVTSTPAAFEALAVALAHDRPRLDLLRQRLLQQRTTAPLFDTPRLARQLESAFTAMFARSRAALPPG